MDFNIKLRNGLVLRGMIQSPGDNTKAVILLVHGLGEHIQRYNYWAGQFKKEGIAFAGVDLPGHGRSDGRRGYIRNYAVLDEMLDILISSCRNTFPGIPLYIYGHSLGGGIVFDYLIRRNPRVTAAIITSPWIKLSFQPSKFKIALASVMKFLLPSLTQPSGLIVEHISHDSKVVENYKNDTLNHGKISVSLFHAAMSAANNSLEHASDLKIKTLLIHGSDDQITSPEGSREMASKSDKVELKIWEGGYHELHNEPFRDDVFKYILSWINR